MLRSSAPAPLLAASSSCPTSAENNQNDFLVYYLKNGASAFLTSVCISLHPPPRAHDLAQAPRQHPPINPNVTILAPAACYYRNLLKFGRNSARFSSTLHKKYMARTRLMYVSQPCTPFFAFFRVLLQQQRLALLTTGSV